jgi:hypothetical protein
MKLVRQDLALTEAARETKPKKVLLKGWDLLLILPSIM